MSFLRKRRKKETEKKMTRKQILTNIFVTIILILAPLALVLLVKYPGADNLIRIDGDFEDWDDITSYHDSKNDQENGNINPQSKSISFTTLSVVSNSSLVSEGNPLIHSVEINKLGAEFFIFENEFLIFSTSE